MDVPYRHVKIMSMYKYAQNNDFTNKTAYFCKNAMLLSYILPVPEPVKLTNPARVLHFKPSYLFMKKAVSV
jgi:hypothetical protein